MEEDRTDQPARGDIHALRYRQLSFPLSNDIYGDERLPPSTAEKIWTVIKSVCVAFGMLVLCCWWTLLMMWFNPPPRPSDTATSDTALFKACETNNWSGLDVFFTLASLAFARVLQAPTAPLHHAFGIKLLLFSPLAVLAETLWMWFCVIWTVATRRSFLGICSAVRMYRTRGLRCDISFEPQKKGGDSSVLSQWNYGDNLAFVGKTSSKSTRSAAQIQEKGNSDDAMTNDLMIASQRRNPLLTCAVYILMIIQHYKIQSVTGAGFIKFIVFVYEIAFMTTETIYLMPNPGASMVDAANAMKAFLKDASYSEANPFSDSVVAPIFMGSVGGSFVFAVMAYGVSQLFSAFAILFPEDVTNSLALTTAIALALKMLIVIPGTFGCLGLAIALPFWVVTVGRAWNALFGRSARDLGPLGSWDWIFAPVQDLQSWYRLRTAMLNYSGVVLWLVLFWDLVRMRDGKLPFVQHPDLAYNCSSTIRESNSWLFLY